MIWTAQKKSLKEWKKSNSWESTCQVFTSTADLDIMDHPPLKELFWLHVNACKSEETLVMKWVFWTLEEVFLQENFRKKPSTLWRSLKKTQWATKLLLNLEDTSVDILFIFWPEFWEKELKTERTVTIWMSLFTTALTAIWWMEWVLRTVWTSFIRKLTLKVQNQVESTKLTIQLCLVWLVMAWTSLQRISIPQLKWRSVIGYVFLAWEPIHMDPKVTSTEWEALRKLSDGTQNYTRTSLNRNSQPKEFAFADFNDYP